NELNIVTNGRAQIMTEQAWSLIDEAKPEGYYILGYPDEWNEKSEPQVSGKQIIHSDFAGLACLPVQRIHNINIDIEEDKQFWSRPSAFYGQLVPFIDAPDAAPRSIVGMSGGP